VLKCLPAGDGGCLAVHWSVVLGDASEAVGAESPSAMWNGFGPGQTYVHVGYGTVGEAQSFRFATSLFCGALVGTRRICVVKSGFVKQCELRNYHFSIEPHHKCNAIHWHSFGSEAMNHLTHVFWNCCHEALYHI
jgi:hypothetical protein